MGCHLPVTAMFLVEIVGRITFAFRLVLALDRLQPRLLGALRVL